MPNHYDTELPDQIHAFVDLHRGGSRQLNVRTITVSDGSPVINVDVGGLTIGMTERNWRALFAAIEQVDIPIPTKRLTFNDDDRHIAVEVIQ